MLSMKGGKGETSYLKNSHAQAIHAKAMLRLLEAALDAVKLPPPSTAFVVADLGCSSGTNSITLARVIVSRVSNMYTAAGRVPPEFQVFFSDLPTNDFNVLFQLLPPHTGSAVTVEEQRPYYAAGVPGSFYGPLFPARSINVVNSTFSLHWLSQVPRSVLDDRSAAYSGECVSAHGASVDTANAFKQQFHADLTVFLSARAAEMRPGGVMFLAFLGRTSSDPTDQCGVGFLFGGHFQDAWNDLVEEGLVESRKRDGFNVPAYAACLEEVRAAVEAEGSFAINKLELVRGGSPLVVADPDDAGEAARALASSCQTVIGGLMEAHLGHKLSEELFARMECRAASRAARELMERAMFHVVASLTFAPAQPETAAYAEDGSRIPVYRCAAANGVGRGENEAL